jgi:S1-C subfamily serine protease
VQNSLLPTAALAALLIGPHVLAQSLDADAPPAPAAAPAAPAGTDSGRDLEARLAAARRQLEIAARQVAELSVQMGQPLIQRYSMVGEAPGRAIIGVQLDTSSGTDGARVLDVSPGGPAAEAGIHAGDVITAIDGREVTGDRAARRVVEIVRGLKPDSKVNVRVRRDGKSREFTVVARPGFGPIDMGDGPPGLPALPMGPFPGAKPLFMMQGPLMNMELATLTPRLGAYFGTAKGVLVVRAPADGALKLEDGDVILSIDGREPTSGSHATRILASYQPGEKVGLKIMRERKVREIVATMPGPAHGADDALAGDDHVYVAPRRMVILRGGGDRT